MEQFTMSKVEKIKAFFKVYGINLFVLKNSLKGLTFYRNDYRELCKQKGNNEDFPFGRKFPVLNDRFASSGIMSGHYFHQDLYVAGKIFQRNPAKHLDIGSRTDGFVAHIAVFRKIEVMDIRQQESKSPNIIFKQGDLMQLPANMIEAYPSISTLHAIEHFGLGRYGDPIDYQGHLKAIRNITKILQKDGILYFSVPIGPQRIEFNAHRVFSIAYLLDIFKDEFELNSFSFVDDKGDFHQEIDLTEEKIKNCCGCNFGCGIFELTKK